MTRPAIPAEIRRKVLMESGHRCAIPHCGHLDVDLHHIIPYEQCMEHASENLIALCPNCHRLCHSNKIDRKSLIQYKQRGQKIFSGEKYDLDSPKYPNGSLEVEISNWQVQKFSELDKGHLKYEIEVEYPVFNQDKFSWAEEVNSAVKYGALEHISGIRNLANEAPWTWAFENKEVGVSEGVSSFVGSFEVTLLNEYFVSIRFSFFSYYRGANHPNHFSRTLNYFIKPVYLVKLFHLYEFDLNYLEVVSKSIRQELLKSYGSEDGKLNDQMLHGTKPELENFKDFNLTPNGVLFTFDEYSIAPYVSGRHEVLLPLGSAGLCWTPNLTNRI